MKKLALFLALIMMCSAVLPLLSSCQNKGNDATADKPLSPPSLNIDPALEKDFYVQAEGEDIVIVGVKDDSIKELVIPEGVTVIGDSAFTGCDYLEKITIADSVKVIQQFAFSSCNLLKTVEIGENSQLTAIEEYAFDRLEHFCIPKQVRSISPKAFDRDFLVSLEVDKSNETYQTLDNSLYSKDGKTLHIFVNSQKTDSFSVPNGVVTIGFGAFAGDSRLTHIELPDSIQYIEESAFAGCESLQYHDDNGVKYLGNERCPRLALISYDPYSFSGLTEYVIPAETQSIMTDAFDGYHGGVDASVEQGNPYFKAVDGVIYSKDGTELVYHSRMSNTQFDIPNGVTTIRDYAFFATPNLKKLTMPSSVTHIGKYGLAYTSLETIQLSNNLTYIGDYAFAGCGITSIRIPDSVTYMGDRVFWNASNLQSVTLSASCSTITDSMFLQCTGLNEIVIPSNIRIIESYAFGYCENLTNVTVTEGVTEIRSGAFANCYSLESIHIPASVANINSRAFYQCNALKTIHVSSKNPYYSSKDGHLYSKDQTVFLLYARGNEAVQFTVPKTVTTIGKIERAHV